jgi:serine/alanine adding enzyme
MSEAGLLSPPAHETPLRTTPPLQITSEVSQPEWDQFVRTHTQASPYHAWNWRAVFERGFGLTTEYLAAREDGAVVGILPLVIFRSRLFGRFAVSLPFVDIGGVCARDEHVARQLVDHAAALAIGERLSHVELRHTARLLPSLPLRQHKVRMLLTLEKDAARGWNALDRKVRNQVRKAEKSDLVARQGGIELVDRFYDVFAQNMRDLGTPVWPIRFFEEVLTTLAASARVFLVDHHDVTVAGAIVFNHGDWFAVPWASSLREYRSQCPNNLLYWRIIEQAIAAGATTLDFGRSTPDEGTYHFKGQWGARPEPLHWEYSLSPGAPLPNLSPSNPRFGAAIATWKRLPVPLTRWLGPRISRSIP